MTTLKIKLTLHLGNTDRDHLDGGSGVVVAGRNLGNLHDKIHVFGNLSKDRVSRGSLSVEPIEEAVVSDVEEELGSSRLGSSLKVKRNKQICNVSYNDFLFQRACNLVSESSNLPVLAMLRVPTSLEIFWWACPISSGMPPSWVRVMVSPVQLLKVDRGVGPPVPARGLLGSLEWGQPNWFIKLGICNPRKAM